jgi:hypothetical protein
MRQHGVTARAESTDVTRSACLREMPETSALARDVRDERAYAKWLRRACLRTMPAQRVLAHDA